MKLCELQMCGQMNHHHSYQWRLQRNAVNVTSLGVKYPLFALKQCPTVHALSKKEDTHTHTFRHFAHICMQTSKLPPISQSAPTGLCYSPVSVSFKAQRMDKLDKPGVSDTKREEEERFCSATETPGGLHLCFIC